MEERRKDRELGSSDFMITSAIWDKKWSDARAQGIDGFTVGFRPGTHPGAIHWERYCDCCKVMIEYNVMPREIDKPDFCLSCEKYLEKSSTPVWYPEL